jgi:cytochrome c-type biogenesis protein CcmH/NrfG
MTINLAMDEVALLADLLRNRTEQLRVEVRRTDDPQYHDELRELEQRTLELLRKLEHMT